MYELPAAGVTTTHEWEIKRSRFITLIRRVRSEHEAREFIAETRHRYPDARHHCSAYILHVERANPVERSSDDGEPAGTAGKPMLDMLRGSGMLDLAVVVVRYFGGIKLGAGGLVHAYSNSVGEALPLVKRVTRAERELHTVEFPHSDAGRWGAELRARGADVVEIDYGAVVTYTLAIDPGELATLNSLLASVTSGRVTSEEAGSAWVESN